MKPEIIKKQRIHPNANTRHLKNKIINYETCAVVDIEKDTITDFKGDKIENPHWTLVYPKKPEPKCKHVREEVDGMFVCRYCHQTHKTRILLFEKINI